MKKAILLFLIALTTQTFGQPITSISTLHANKSDYFNQGFFVTVTVANLYSGTKWYVYDATDTIKCDFKNVTMPTSGQLITIVALGIDYGNIELEARYYYPAGNTPNLHTTIADIISNPVHGQVVVLNGAVTGILSGSNDDYYFEDNTGTIEADWELLMKVPDYWKQVELWGVVDNSGSYVDVNVWAWYAPSSQAIPENELDISLYPNPATSFIHVPETVNYTHAAVFDMTGRKWLGFTNTGSTMDVSKLQSGYYILLLYHGSELILREKFVVSR